MSTQKITNFEDDLFMTVRGIQVLKSEIKKVEQMTSGKLIKDNDIQLIVELDGYWKGYFMQKGCYPDIVALLTHPSEYFIPVRIRVQNPIISDQIVDGRWDRPVWFRCKRNMLVQRVNL